jgi:hypothetical protein
VDSTCGRQEVASAVRLSCGDVWRQKAVSTGLAVIAPPFRAVRAALRHTTFDGPVHLDKASESNGRVRRISGRYRVLDSTFCYSVVRDAVSVLVLLA